MPSLAHEVLAVRLRERPDLLSMLLSALHLPALPDGLTVDDSTLRLVQPVELRPDLVLAQGESGPWVLVEIQIDPDPVITSHRSTALWAESIAASVLHLVAVPKLTSVVGLASLSDVGSLEIVLCPLLPTLDGLGAVRDPYNIEIINNDTLADITALHGAGSVTTLTVTGNPQLPAVDAQALANALQVFGSATIGSNGP